MRPARSAPRPARRRQSGRVTVAALLGALAIGGLSYAAVKYLPLYRDFATIKAIVSETGQRAVAMRDKAGARQWFDEQMRGAGFAWLRAGSLYWQPVDRDHLDVGVRYEVQIDHLVGSQTLVFSWYCTASPDGCRAFSPRFTE